MPIKENDIKIGLTIIELIIKYGFQAAMKIINTWNKNRKTITDKDIDELKASITPMDDVLDE